MPHQIKQFYIAKSRRCWPKNARNVVVGWVKMRNLRHSENSQQKGEKQKSIQRGEKS